MEKKKAIGKFTTHPLSRECVAYSGHDLGWLKTLDGKQNRKHIRQQRHVYYIVVCYTIPRVAQTHVGLATQAERSTGEERQRTRVLRLCVPACTSVCPRALLARTFRKDSLTTFNVRVTRALPTLAITAPMH